VPVRVSCARKTDGSGNNLQATIASLPNGGTATFKTTVGVNGDAPDTTQLEYSAGSSANDPNSGNNGDSNFITVTGANPDGAGLVITKTGPAKAPDGSLVTYKIVVKNNGPATATNVRATDDLPGNGTCRSARRPASGRASSSADR